MTWHDAPVARALADLLGRPVHVENDCTSGAFAEWRVGAATGHDDVLYVGVGTGIGGGLIVNGGLARGAHGWAGEIGHIIVQPDGEICGCGNRGCWETVASGSAITREGRIALTRHAHSALAAMTDDPAAVTGEMVSEAARAGDAAARGILAEVGARLGQGIAGLVNVLDPSIVVVGGGASEAGELLLEPARRAYGDAVQADGGGADRRRRAGDRRRGDRRRPPGPGRRRVRCGLSVPVFTADVARPVAAARAAADAGFDAVFAPDHVFPPGRPDRPSVEATTLLAACAAAAPGAGRRAPRDPRVPSTGRHAGEDRRGARSRERRPGDRRPRARRRQRQGRTRARWGCRSRRSRSGPWASRRPPSRSGRCSAGRRGPVGSGSGPWRGRSCRPAAAPVWVGGTSDRVHRRGGAGRGRVERVGPGRRWVRDARADAGRAHGRGGPRSRRRGPDLGRHRARGRGRRRAGRAWRPTGPTRASRCRSGVERSADLRGVPRRPRARRLRVDDRDRAAGPADRTSVIGAGLVAG